MKWLKALFVLLIILVGCTVYGLHVFNTWLNEPVAPLKLSENDALFKIETGDTLSGISQRLAADELIAWPKFWVMYAKFNQQTGVKVGEYRFNYDDTPKSILKKFNRADVIYHSLRFNEGQTFREVLSILAQEPKLKKMIDTQSDESIIKSLGLKIDALEGWFFPDTYSFISGETDKDILLRAHAKMRSVLGKHWENRQENLPYASAYEALIMASIIEKETGVARERPEIAGVFVRRLDKKMRLQTDPTVIYGMGERYKGNITRKDLRTPTPFNTYTNHGLPPTPIAMPGEHAIKAAFNPLAGTSLFFVGKGDGTHYFSDTLQEHNQAVKRYQLKRVEGYRSSPKK